MTLQPFSIKQAFKYGIMTTFDHLGFIIGLLFLVIGLYIAGVGSLIMLAIGSAFFSFMGDKSAFSSGVTPLSSWADISFWYAFLIIFFVGIAIVIFTSWINLGLLKVALHIYDTQEARYSYLFGQWRVIWSYLIARFLYVSMVTIGLLLFLVPGIYLAIMYWFYTIALVDKQLGPLQALSYSRTLTAPARGRVFLFALVCALLVALTPVSYGISLLIVTPIIVFAQTYVYKKLVYAQQIKS